MPQELTGLVYTASPGAAQIRTRDGGRVSLLAKKRGAFIALNEGLSVTFKGVVAAGDHFEASGWELAVPTQDELALAIKDIFNIPGVKEKRAEAIAQAFEDNELKLLIEDPGKAFDVIRGKPISGVSKEALDLLKARYIRALGPPAVRALGALLGPLEVEYTMLVEINDFFKEDSGRQGLDPVKVLQRDPYYLATHGFQSVTGLSAYALGEKLSALQNQSATSTTRVIGAIMSVIWEEATKGHTCSKAGQIFYLAQFRLGQGPRAIPHDDAATLVNEVLQGKTVPKAPIWTYYLGDGQGKTERYIYAAPLSIAEKAAAQGFAEQKRQPLFKDREETYKRALSEARLPGIKKTDNFLASATRLLTQPLTILKGPAGTGKTTLVYAAVQALKAVHPNAQIALTATTGKAAQRLAEVVGEPATTLHSWLGIRPGDLRAKSSREPVDLLVIDEASMMDISLAGALGSLLQSPDHPRRLLICGDEAQLPPVGAGKVLWDLIEAFPDNVVALTKIYRQEKGNILDLASQIREGTLQSVPESTADVQVRQVPVTSQQVIALAAELLREGWRPEDIMILTAQRQTSSGVEELNRALRGLFNPSANPDWAFSVGDRVVQMANFRREEEVVWNGLLGYVREVDYTSQGPGAVTVEYETPEGITASYNRGQWGRYLSLGYALTIHKSQGSEAPVVVLIASPEHADMWLDDRSLAYTAVTRARKKLYVLGDPNILVHAAQAKPSSAQNRRGFLVKRITEEG